MRNHFRRNVLIYVILALSLHLNCLNASEMVDTDKTNLIQLFKETYANETVTTLAPEIPRNISDIYKGIWMFQKTGKMDFKKINGRAVFKILNEKSAYEKIDIVYGSMTLRDGLYTTNKNTKLSLQGLYFWNTGELIMLGNPYQSSISPSSPMDKTISPSPPHKDEDGEDDVEDLKKKEENFLENIKFNFSANHVITVEDIMTQFAKIRNHSEKSEITSNKCYYEIYMKFAHYDKFADPEMKKKMEEDPNYFDERQDGSANPFIEQYGVSYSPNCKTEMKITTNSIYFDDYYRKALNYVVFMCVATFIEVVVLLDQVEFTNSQTSISKVSIITIGQQAILDSYICLVHLTAGLMMDPCFSAFAIASFLKFVSFSIFQMRYLLSIWKSRLEGVGNIRLELGVFYMRFYSILFSGFILLYYFFSFFEIFLILFYSYWVPQIYSNCIGNYAKSLKMKYVIGTTIARLFLPFYFLGCPKNFLFVEPKPKLILFLVVWLFMQNLVLWLQDKIGSRFFIPNFFAAPKYDYHHSLDLSLLQEDNKRDVVNEGNNEEDEENGQFNCVICLCPIDVSSNNVSDNNAYMITPCNHLYHKHCLMQWMEHKMECCVCKRRLPFI